jgi:hypothetical protein
MKKVIQIALTVSSTLILLVGCATTVPVMVTKPAEVNMSSMKRVAVLEFKITQEHQKLSIEDLFELALDELFGLEIGGRALEREISDYTTERFILTLVRTNYFHVLGPTDIKQSMQMSPSSSESAQQIGKAVDAQAILNGDIYSMHSQDEETTTTEEVADPENQTIREITTTNITRTAWLGLRYYVIKSESGEVVATRSFESSIQNTKDAEEQYLLPSEEEMYKDIIDSFMPQVERQLAPYTVRERRKLMKDKSKNPLMKEAERYAKGGVHDRALELYLEVWESTGNPAAGNNAAIMYEASGNIDGAIDIIEDVVARSSDKKIIREYNRLLRAREEQERLAEQL